MVNLHTEWARVVVRESLHAGWAANPDNRGNDLNFSEVSIDC